MVQALDSFVLTGAIKKYRMHQKIDGDFRHHTMLAHTSAFRSEHQALKELVEDAWAQGEYHSPASSFKMTSWRLMRLDIGAEYSPRARRVSQTSSGKL